VTPEELAKNVLILDTRAAAHEDVRQRVAISARARKSANRWVFSSLTLPRKRSGPSWRTVTRFFVWAWTLSSWIGSAQAAREAGLAAVQDVSR
jgi:hypothetical protein